MGLATDGGLLLPESIPEVSPDVIQSWATLSYQELAFRVFSLFIDDIPAEDLQELISRSYAKFGHPEITPVTKVGPIYLLELFHGPTLAFKDVALQFLGNLFEYMLKQSQGRMNILGATSGDTGSAAIHGVRGKERINIFILHPHKRVSAIQELQMTSVIDANVFNVAIQGTFDDGQGIVKAIFNDIPFKTRHALGAINSINWARVLAQVVYYLYAWFRVKDLTKAERVDFSVPTGNFGDIFAGYVARRLVGAGIRSLVLATNANDLLARFILNGEYCLGKVVQTSSPSMDIQVSSNFERYLYYLHEENPDAVRRDMEQFAATGQLLFSQDQKRKAQAAFATKSVSETECRATISATFSEHGVILDPHTAVGVNAGLAHRAQNVPMICLATAHPAKFSEAVARAIGRKIDLPPCLAALQDCPTRCDILSPEVTVIKDYVAQHAL